MSSVGLLVNRRPSVKFLRKSSYMWTLDCEGGGGVTVPNPCIVQGATVVMLKDFLTCFSFRMFFYDRSTYEANL